jgi:multiple sugar transport system substrate-binding protein
MNTARRTLLKAAALAPLMTVRSTGWAQAAEVVWWAPNWGQARAEELVKRFQAGNPDLRVKIEVTVADGLQNRVLTALRSGAPPDLSDINSGWNIPYALTGELLAIDDFVQQQKIDLADFLPAPLATARVGGKLMGLPYRMEGHGFIYNRGAYKEAGLDPDKPPRTWDDLVEYSKRLTRKTADGKQQYGLGVCGGGEVGNVIFRAMPLIWMNGGSVVSDDMKRAVVNEPAAVQAVDFYTSPFTKLGTAPPSTLQNDGLAIRRLFIAGVVAQYQSGQFDIPPIRKENPAIDIGVARLPTPKGKDPAVVMGGWSFIIPKAAKNVSGAARLMGFLGQPDNMGYYTDTFPARKSPMSMQRFQDPILTAFREMLPYARPVPPVRDWLQCVQIFFDQTQRILLKEASPQDAMNEAAKGMQRLLDRA